MFERLKESGYELGVATGRARIEMEVPFKTYGWDEEFESNYLATPPDPLAAPTTCPSYTSPSPRD